MSNQLLEISVIVAGLLLWFGILAAVALVLERIEPDLSGPVNPKRWSSAMPTKPGWHFAIVPRVGLAVYLVEWTYIDNVKVLAINVGTPDVIAVERTTIGHWQEVTFPALPKSEPPKWRAWFLLWALRFEHAKMAKRSAFCWRAARFLAPEKTHQRLAAHTVSLLVFGEF